MNGLGTDTATISRRIRACDYMTVAQIFLQDNFLLNRPLEPTHIKPRLLGHWGTCHGINVTYAYLQDFYAKDPNFSFVLGPGHGFPALQANLFYDGELEKVDPKATRNLSGLKYICRQFSWPDGFPSHASPITPGVISEGGELGYALAIAYGAVLGRPKKTVAVLIGDGELETATAVGSLNLVKLLGGSGNGHVIPILHLNGYKISGPTIYGRKSPRELGELFRGFGYTPIFVNQAADFPAALQKSVNHPFIIYKNQKGATGPRRFDGQKIAGNYLSHQVPLKNAKTDARELQSLSDWLESYRFAELFDEEKGFHDRPY